jgi:hypothetical protein
MEALPAENIHTLKAMVQIIIFRKKKNLKTRKGKNEKVNHNRISGHQLSHLRW